VIKGGGGRGEGEALCCSVHDKHLDGILQHSVLVPFSLVSYETRSLFPSQFICGTCITCEYTHTHTHIAILVLCVPHISMQTLLLVKATFSCFFFFFAPFSILSSNDHSSL
jgi:hypothetical protein